MITITEETARRAITALKAVDDTLDDYSEKRVFYREALSEIKDRLEGWKESLSEIPPMSAVGERFVVRAAGGIEYKCVLIKCLNNGNDQLFTRLGSHDDDVCFTAQVTHWRYDD